MLRLTVIRARKRLSRMPIRKSVTAKNRHSKKSRQGRHTAIRLSAVFRDSVPPFRGASSRRNVN